MITRLTNFIGNKKVIWRVIFIIVILIIGYSFFFYTTRKEFDTDGDGEIDKVDYYRKGVKIKEAVYFDKVYLRGISYIYWNKDGSINKIIKLYSDSNFPFTKDIDIYSKGVKIYKYGKALIRQELIESKVFDRERKIRNAQVAGRVFMYLEAQRKIISEIYEENSEKLIEIISFDENGRISQTKEDKDSNGKFDYYEYYEHGKKTAVGYDYDEDGEIDKKEEVKNKSR